MQELQTPGDHARGVLEYDGGNGRVLRMYLGGGEPPLHPSKVKAATEFQETVLPLLIGQLLAFRAGRLPVEEHGPLLNLMREHRAACNALERVARVSGHGLLEAYNGAIDGVQSARFGDRRFENRVAEFLSLVDRLFPKLFRAAEAAALSSVAPAGKSK